ncbi:MAG TPA: hypothetical protein VMV37_09270 [Gammaproteobacteria bacterium]|nr:hypothetical protein [Gammaproteobacteria bacterium]
MNSTMWEIALRTLARDKTYALINVAGLARCLTVALQSLKAARAHPVRALRYE